MADDGRRKHALVVDDSPTIRRMVRASLSAIEGLDLDEAANGLEAIEKISLSPVDLVVLDMNMPDMHGLDVIRFLRAHERYARISILVLTTRSDDSLRNESMAAGASLYMNKPFAPQELADRAGDLLRKTGGA